jgi:drug/metabolite transporter (DMT)-like permease
MLLSLLMFTGNSLLIKYLGSNQQISPWIALLFRAAVGLVIVSLFFGNQGGLMWGRALTNRMLATRGLLGVLGSIAYYLTVPELGVGKATLISCTYVVLAAVMAIWVLKERLSLSKICWLVIASCGVGLLVEISPSELSRVGFYDAVAIVGSFLAAGTVIVIRQLTRTESTATIYASQCIFILLGSLPAALYYWHGLRWEDLGLLVLAGICATYGQLGMTEGFRHLTVAVGGSFQIVLPVVISLGGYLLFDERFSLPQIIGATLILTGCYAAMVIK